MRITILSTRIRKLLPTIREIYRLFHADRLTLLLGVICIFISSLLIIPMPMMTKRLIDSTLPNKDVHELLMLIILLFALLLILSGISYSQNMIFSKVNHKAILKLRVRLLDRLSRVPLAILNQYEYGYLLARVNEDAERIEVLFVDELTSIVNDFGVLIFGLIMLFYLRPGLAAVCLLLVPPYIWASVHYSKKIQREAQNYYESQAKSTESLTRSMQLIEMCKIYNQYGRNLRVFFHAAKNEYRSFMKFFKVNMLFEAIIGIIGGLAPVIILALGGLLILQGKMTIGSLVAFNAFAGYLFGPLNKLTQVKATLEKAFVAVSRIDELLNFEQEPDLKTPSFLEHVEQIEMKNVSFGYHDKQILVNINLHAEKGDIIGITGPSGCGKTTLLRILCGLYAAQSGQMKFNSYLLSKEEYPLLRYLTAYAPIDPILIDGNIREQLSMACPNLINEEIAEFMRQAGLTGFIENLQHHWKHKIVHGGKNFSSGQRQRIMLATALAKPCSILVIDEALVNLDFQLKTHILVEIDKIRKNKIIFVVSHDPYVLQKCNLVYHMENGELMIKNAIL